MTGRGRWHRRVGWLPLLYLAAIVVLGIAHPVLPAWRWLAIHVLLLGAVTNAILVFSAHFSLAVLRAPAPASRRGESARLAVLNVGVLTVLAAGALGAGWVAAAGAIAVFAAVGAHLFWLWARLRSALPAPYVVTVRFYVAASLALLTGIPAGAWMLIVDDPGRSRLVLFHAHINLLGWVTLTVLGTTLTLWPTVLRTRVVGGAVAAAERALPLACVGLLMLGAAVLAWWPIVAVAGLALIAAALVVVLRPAMRAAAGKPPVSFAALSIAAAAAWLLAALVIDAVTLIRADGPDAAADQFGNVLVPLLIGFAAQTLVGALAYLLPVMLGGGPARVRAADAALDRRAVQRVVTANLALLVFLLPVGPYVRITTSLLVLVGLVQFLIPALGLVARRARRSDAEPLPRGGHP